MLFPSTLDTKLSFNTLSFWDSFMCLSIHTTLSDISFETSRWRMDCVPTQCTRGGHWRGYYREVLWVWTRQELADASWSTYWFRQGRGSIPTTSFLVFFCVTELILWIWFLHDFLFNRLRATHWLNTKKRFRQRKQFRIWTDHCLWKRNWKLVGPLP